MEEHKQVTVIEPGWQWDRRAHKYHRIERIRKFEMPNASFKPSKRPGYSGNNRAKGLLLLFLSMAGSHRGFTNTEICSRIDLKKSYIEGRGGILTKWGYLSRKLRPNGIFEYSTGDKAESLLNRIPVELYNEWATTIIANNQDLFNARALRQQPQRPVIDRTVQVSKRLFENYKWMTGRLPREFIDRDSAADIEGT